MTSTTDAGVQTTATTFEIIDALLGRESVRIDDLEAELDLTTSTIYRHLTTLREHGYVLKEGERYRLSLKFLTIGGYLRRQTPTYPMIKSKVDELAEETGERAQFMVRERHERVYLYTETGENPVQTGAHTGSRGPIYASAAGKAILAHEPTDRRESLLESFEFEETGPRTITDPDRLREDLATIRERGYAFNREESTSGVHAIGTVVKVDGDIVGALSVSGPATRLKNDRLESELPDVVMAMSNELELHIQHTTSTPVNTIP